jgi:hypothetical protein
MGLSQEQRDRIAKARLEAPLARAREQETKSALQTAQSREQQRLNRALQAQQSQDLRLRQGNLAAAKAEISTQMQIALAYGGGSAAVAEAKRRLAALGGTSGAPSRSDWRSKISYADPATLSREQNAAIRAYTKPAPALQPSAAPGLAAPTAYGDPAARARESEARRMMQQYASKEYWDTEQGKAMMGLAQESSAPQGTKLADYYAAQRGVGVGSMNEILEGLASVDQRYAAGGDLRKWAEANQALALREYNKRFPSGVPGQGGGEASAPTIDTANPSAGEKALMEAKYALYGGPENESNTNTVPGGYVPDDRVIGMNAQGQTTVGEGAYGFDPAYDQLEIAKPPVEPEAARASNLAPTTQTAQQQKADELLKTFANRTRAAMIGN